MSTSYGNAALKTTAGDTIVGGLSMLDKELDRVLTLIGSLTELADRLTGPRPPEAIPDSADPMPPPLGVVDDLHRKRARLAQLLRQCEVERDRISQALS